MKKTTTFILFLTLCCICSTAQATRKVVYLTTANASPFTIPADWSNTNTIEVIGSGGGGGTSTSTFTGSGGGGGGYSKVTNYGYLTAGQTVTFHVSAGGAASTTGGDTYFCSVTGTCASIAGTAVVVGAHGGVNGNATGAVSAGGTIKIAI